MLVLNRIISVFATLSAILLGLIQKKFSKVSIQSSVNDTHAGLDV